MQEDNAERPNGPNSFDVQILSRDGIQAEVDLMTRVIQAIPRNTQRHIRSIFCDSKASSSYTIKVRETGKQANLEYFLARELATLFRRYAGGYNLLDVDGVQLTADWQSGNEND